MASVVLIPAYKPDEKMITLLHQLAEYPFPAIVLVDDGSGEEFAEVFRQALAVSDKVQLVSHAVNLGKGAALKTGINYCLVHYPTCGIVTADCDGQHTPEDIGRVADTMETEPDKLIVGGREFKGKVPARSMFGNTIMRTAFALSTGVRVRDTQTGLRGLPPEIAGKCLSISGNRYEYEMNMLLQMPSWGYGIKEIPIETIYIEDNASSHFHPFRDAMRVFSRLLLFAASSIVSFAVDYILYAVFLGLNSASWAFIEARAISSLVNFALNRHMVFKSKENVVRQAIGYFLLVICIMLIGSWAVGMLTNLGVGKYIAKIITDCVLFMVNFVVQRKIIFRNPKVKSKNP
ncbi:MAG: bifunctional glycosyltransferase family 2/GtrA family protein [Clostridia bacterium]|nr:bifunctional glycosyltransferase family 2/GtrA family protein [Clostridia bacterium]